MPAKPKAKPKIHSLEARFGRPLASMRDAWRAPPRLLISEWAAQYRYLSPEASAEPGLWNNERAPHLIQPMDCLSPYHPAERVVCKFSSQSGKSECLLNFIGYVIDLDPGPILCVQPNVTPMGEAFSKDRVSTMLRDSPSLAEKIGKIKARNSAQTITHKALAVDTPIPTPDGWKAMGDLKVGDQVYGDDGAPCRITYTTPIESGRPCYAVRFSDGATIVADGEHPWLVEWRQGAVGTGAYIEGIKTTEEMRRELRIGTRWRYSVMVCKPIQGEAKELPIDPYVLGAWLGDGYSHAARVVAGRDDREVGDLLRPGAPYMQEPEFNGRLWVFRLDPRRGFEPTCRRGHPRGKTTADGKCRVCHAQFERQRKTGVPIDPVIDNTIHAKLRSLGLLSVAGDGKSLKHIPRVYLRASVDQRLALLQGLLDTDGSITKIGLCRFVTVLKPLALDVAELIQSLGFKATVKESESFYTYKGQKLRANNKFVVSFSPGSVIPVFRLERKLAIQQSLKPVALRARRRQIVAIDPVDSVPVRCIAVDNSSHLYLAGKSFVPTHNTFPGGHLTIAGANSPAGLASRPIRYLICDELDRWEVTKEGDPLVLARKRLQTFRARRSAKEILVSSPTYPDVGISAEYERCTQQWEWQLACQHCGALQFPRLEHFSWDAQDASTVRYVCKSCGAEHPRGQEDRVKLSGRWVCVKDGPETSVGFWFNQWASPFARWDDTVADWIDAQDDAARKQAVVNTAFAEAWDGEGERVEPHSLLNRLETYPAEVPDGGLVLTMGADVQGDRIEAEIVAWGAHFESWSIAYEVLPGEPTGREVWDDLLEFYRATWTHESGTKMRPVALCVDSGAYSQHVYEFVKRARDRGIIPIKGAPGMSRDAIHGDWRQLMKRAARRMHNGRPPEILGVDAIKRTIYHHLSAAPGAPGYCHFPTDRSEEYFLQLTGERLVAVAHRNKRSEYRWVPVHSAVEGLDCRVYAYAALLLSRAGAATVEKATVQQSPAQNPDQAPSKAEPLSVQSQIKRKTPLLPSGVGTPTIRRRASSWW